MVLILTIFNIVTVIARFCLNLMNFLTVIILFRIRKVWQIWTNYLRALFNHMFVLIQKKLLIKIRSC